MCGIAGIWLSDSQETPSTKLLSHMIETIAHRGPDAQQVWANAGIGLAHARLSIIDLDESANQPMCDVETGNMIVFNGEIYNYIELKKELVSYGHQFQTQGDTEVILKAYAQWGTECLNKFNGMWAFALYDRQHNVLFCARDRFGIKPFIYGIGSDGDLIFASEAKAIIQHFSEFKAVNEAFLQDFVERDFFACYKETFYKKMFNILPGHYFVVRVGETPKQVRYWTWRPESVVIKNDDREVISQFKDLLTDAIRLRFRSDVPVGSCLSGGLDSSTIVGIASKLFDRRIHTFSCIYPSTPAFDESEYIHASAQHFNTIPKFIEPQHDDFIEMMRSSIYEQDGPTGGPSILSQRAVMALASQDVKVVLDGQGADELLGGYHAYFRYKLLSNIRDIKKNKSLQSVFRYFLNASKIKKRTGNPIEHFAKMLILTRQPAAFYSQKISDTQLHYFNAFEEDDLNTLLLEHVFTNLVNLLHYEDRNSMRFSIESRLPFLDYRLVEFAFSLPAHYKIRGSTTKWLLHTVAKEVLPQKVLNRKDKMGFSTPAHQWFLQRDNMQYFKQYLHDGNSIYMNLSQSMRDYLLKSFKTLSSDQPFSPAGAGDINVLWRFFTANMWYDSLTTRS